MMNNVEASRILQPEHCAYWPGQARIYITTHGVQVVGLEKT